jgi:hypothetical protein
MNALNRALKRARYRRRSWKGNCSAKGFGKKISSRADRRVGQILCRERV